MSSLSRRVSAIMSLHGKSSFSAQTRYVHPVFFELKKEYPDMLRGLGFHQGRSFPYSERLEQILGTLAHTKVLLRTGSFLNPKYTVGQLTDEEAESLFGAELPVLREMSKKFCWEVDILEADEMMDELSKDPMVKLVSAHVGEIFGTYEKED